MKKRQSFRRWFIVLVAAAVLTGPAALTGPALATEGGGGAYPNGAEDFMVGALPPPGTYFKNYLTYYTASKFKDNNGNDIPVDFKLKVAADVLRFIYVTDYKILGANWAVHAFIPVAYMDVEMGPRSDDRFGLGDIIVDPFILGWHWKNFHVTTGLDIYIPVGTYNQDRLANLGRNYWTFEPVLGMTYLSDGGFEISAKFMYDFNTENDDTNYQSGQEFRPPPDWGSHYATGQGAFDDIDLSDLFAGLGARASRGRSLARRLPACRTTTASICPTARSFTPRRPATRACPAWAAARRSTR